MKRFTTIIAVVALVLALSAPAYAVNATADSYGGANGGVAGISGSGGSGGTNPGDVTAAATGSSGSLPFTGADLGIAAGVGAALILVGYGMRRASRHVS